MTTIERLMTLLEDQRSVLLRLRELVTEERELLISSRLDRLGQLIAEQADLLKKQASLSIQTSREIERIGSALELASPVSLSHILAHLPEPVAARIGAYHRELTGMAEELQREGRVNWHLAQQALKYVDFTLKMIGRAKEGPLPYEPNTQGGQRKGLQLLVDSCA